MPVFEYKVVPAPERGLKGKGVKGPRERFAYALEVLMNELGADGWDYVRADTLPCDERSGLTGSTTTYQNMLVFRREKAAAPAFTTERRSEPTQEAAPTAETAIEIPPLRAVETPVAPTATAPVAEAKPTPPLSASTDAAAAAAAAAALTAYRDSASGAPKLGPAPERRPERD